MTNHQQTIKRTKFILITITLYFLGMTNLFAQSYPPGSIHGLFSINDFTQVCFSQGNLQYKPSINTWRFAENQWDFAGSDNWNMTDTCSYWIDLFGWGTSGYNHGAQCYQPWSSSTNDTYYWPYGICGANLYDNSGQADWGYNAILNGSNLENIGWRTLSLAEWSYIFNTRSTPSGIRYVKAQVNNVNGVILLPDNWNANYYSFNSTNNPTAGYNSNVISVTQWVTLEQYGAVFLPAAGGREYISISGVGTSGSYWSSKCMPGDDAWLNAYLGVTFSNSSLYSSTWSTSLYHWGCSVRLARATQDYTFIIEAAPNSAEGGIVSGGGVFIDGNECTLTATASEGYHFLNWTEDGEMVSMDATYTFIANRNRLLVANFVVNFEGNVPLGAINGKFTVNSNGNGVYFSQGNLQYKASTNTWRFAEEQYDFIGSANSNISSSYSGWIDLFGWGTSGYNHGANCYQPWSTSTVDGDYYAYGSNTFNLYDQTGQADWGWNAILNGSNMENRGWHTLTSDEWWYLFYSRNTLTGIRFAKAQVNNVNGVILLPDDWNAIYYSLNNTNMGAASYSSNVISASQWAIIEQYGAVFLPAASYRGETLVVDLSRGYGVYWSSSFANSSNYARSILFNDSEYFDIRSSFPRSYGISVRLVRDFQDYSYDIDVTPSSEEGGVVSGGGTYIEDSECTLTATANEGYHFYTWTENGEVVSTNATYTFIVTRDRTLMASFVANGGGTASSSPTGSINGKFSVNSNGDKVFFSQGNLQYQASTGTWRFAENQYDYVGSANSNISSSYSGWIDLFGWGTSGYNHGANCYQPWSTSTTNGDYYAYGNNTYNLFDQTGQADWGWNAIYNGGNQENLGWRTLTHDEWAYLFNTRSTPSGIRYAKAQVNNVNGVILLPEDWDTSVFYLSNTNNNNASFSSNVLSISQWGVLEQFGAVFLPAAGYRNGSSVRYDNSRGFYWSSTYPYFVYYYDSNLNPDNPGNTILYYGMSVRLVCPYAIVIGATSIPSEGGSVSGGGNYQEGSTCTLAATANTGYHFVCWSEDGVQVSTNATYSFTVSESRNLIAHFALNTYSITALTNPTAGGIITGADTYNYGESCTLMATPAVGYTFTHWTRNDTVVSTDAEMTFTVTEAASYVAVFTINTYSIGVSANPSEGGTVSGAGTYYYGSNCTLTAIPATGYLFLGWYKDGNQLSSLATYTFAVTEASTYEARFIRMTYGIIATADPSVGGTVSGTGVYQYGANCTLTATPNNGYTFANWTQDGTVVSTAASYTFTVTDDASFVAHFTANSYNITATANPNGGGTVNGGGSYNYGTSCTLTASPATGYTFSNWTQNGTPVSTNATFTFTVTGDASFVAHFTTNNYNITATANPTGGGTVNGGGSYNYGSTCTLTALPATGYTFSNWSQNGTPVSTNATFSFTVTGDASFVAHFTANSYNIIATANPTGGGTVNGGGSYNYGTTCTLMANANAGYTFVNWTENGTVVSTDAAYSFTVNEPRSLVANFSLNSFEVLAEAHPEEGGTVTGGGTYNYGETATLTATANEGYTFDHWSDGYASEYFTIESLEDGNTITLTIPEISTITSVAWSKDGATWTTFDHPSATTITVEADANEKVLWKGIATTYALSQTVFCNFTAAKTHEIKGNLMSLLYGDDFANANAFPNGASYNFGSLFKQDVNLVSAANLRLPVLNLVQNCYKLMFQGCTSLETAPELPATTLANSCYYAMFQGCTLLSDTPELPATSMANYCYYSMFQSCSSLKTAPVLPATTLAGNCYGAMFRDCTSLLSAPELPAIVMYGNCYNYMFYGCTSLTSAPVLPATTLADYCYKDMLHGCSSITTAPELPATVLKPYCYTSLFYGCSSLTQAPVLPAMTLVDYCYSNMFNGCTSLNEVTCLATELSATGCTNTWLNNVASIGTFHKAAEMTGWATGTSGIPANWTVEDVTTDYQTPFEEQYFTIESLEDGNTITLTIPAVITTSYMTSVSYSTDNGATWNTTDIDGTAKTITVSLANSGDKVLFKGIGRTLTYGNSHDNEQSYFSASKQYIVYGNIASLLYGDDFEDKTQFPNNSARTYQGLFRFSTTLVSAQHLVMPFNVVAGHCFRDMFQGCTALTQAPALPATTLNSDCYMNMFNSCTALTHAPELPATTLASECYNQMFRGCSSLTHAPELPAQTLAYMCYYLMFHSCSSLAQAPNLPAATLVNKCYQSMFYGCSSLSEVTCLATDISATDCTASWMNGVASTGIFHKASGMNDWPTGVSGIPSGWTVFEEAPVDPTEPSFSYTVTEDRYWLANFTLNSYEINASASPVEGGTVTGTGTYNHFDNCTLMANANAGYTFVNWTENDTEVSTDATYIFTVTGPRTLSANFSLNSYSITVAADPVEGGTITGAGTYAHGANVTLTATANTGYTFVNWTKDGIQVSTSPTYSFSVTEPGAYAAHFSLNSYEVLTGTDPEAGGTVTGGGTYNYGETATLTATANEGYTFDHWSDGYASEYFTIESLEDGNTITLTIGAPVTQAQMQSISYSTDDGATWNTTTIDDTEQVISVSVNANEKVLWKGTGVRMATSWEASSWCSFNGTKQHIVYGNIASLLFDDDFEGQTVMPTATNNDGRNYQRLFSGDTKLVSAQHLILPFTTLRQICYWHMFNGCTSLTTAPEVLPATTLPYICYGSMFYNCSSLTTVPELPATTLAQECYGGMFRGCTSLKKVPELPATTMATKCYEQMFMSCTSLTTAPALPGTTLASYCYRNMFQGCTSLTRVPGILPAMELQPYCYSQMFRGCTALNASPILPAPVLVERCYEYMFNGDSSLNKVTCLATDISASDPVVSWMTNVGQGGTFYKHPSMTAWPQPSGTGIPGTWTVEDITTDYQTPFEEQYFTIESLEDGNTITLTIGSAVTQAQMQSISYSIDNGATWAETTIDDTEQIISVSLNAGEKVLWKGTGTNLASGYSNATQWSIFGGTKRHIVYGNITSLLFGDDYIGQYSLPVTPNNGRNYQRLFSGDTKLISAEHLMLPFTILQRECYGNLFQGCSSLVSVPELPATVLTEVCYSHMFCNCLSLVKAPELPATTMMPYCYRQMFQGCTSLTEAPELLAPTLVGNCYQNMFNGCTSLNEVTCLATDISATDCTASWMNGVASTGIFHKASGMNDWPTGVSGIPSGWTVFEEAPADPTEPNFSYTVTEDRYWLAHFTLNSYEVTASVSPVEGGTVTGTGTYNHFDNCTLMANANAGYTFVNWTENDNPVSTDAAYSFTVTGPRTLSANFSLNSYSITVAADPVEGGTITGAGTYAHGANVTLTATANTGYTFVNWTKDGFQVSTSPTYTFSVTEPGAYAAHFSLNSYEVLTGTDPEAAGSVTGGGTYNYGETATLTATANEGYTFDHWSDGYASEYFTIESLEDGNTITLTIGSAVTSAQLTYVAWSKDKVNWTSTTIDDTEQVISVPANAHEKVYWKGEGTRYAYSYQDATQWSVFSAIGQHKVCGNIASLLFGDDFVGITALPVVSRCYQRLFSDDTNLTDANNLILPFTDIQAECYGNMFQGCTSLISVPELPATTLKSYCYQSMFYGCSSLTEAPVLPATTLSSYCYNGMFMNCTSLTQAPVLPATTLANYCYRNMFAGCTSLSAAPALPATTLANYCYNQMFQGCTSLQFAPALPATSLTERCYWSMFYGCTSLEQGPELPAATLTDYCYDMMFKNCSSLTKAPVLPAQTLTQYCYYQMFQGCSLINEITCLATDISATGATSGWLYNASSTGTFHKAADMTDWPASTSGIPGGWTVEDYIDDYAAEYFTIESLEDGNTITLTIGSAVTSAQLTYVAWSKDKTNWTSTTVDDTEQVISVPANAHEKVYWKGEGTNYASGFNNNTQWSIFSATGWHKVYGNIASLLFGDGFEDAIALPSSPNNGRNYQRLFSGDINLTDASNLLFPFTTIQSNCFASMFLGCSNLIQGPRVFPALTARDYSYSNMFDGCSSLITVPEMPATTLGYSCYSSMFNDCTSLIIAPTLPATTMVALCYLNMFNGCTSLSQAPTLQASILATSCYNKMFQGCSSLTMAPDLPAIELASSCYQSMFEGCSALVSVSVLPATTLQSNCYRRMFANCTSLNEVTCLATDISATDCLTKWLVNVASMGIFHKASGMNDWPTGVSGIPSGWTVFEAAPVDPTEPSFSYTVTEDRYWLAHFILNSYEITASASPVEGGTVTGSGTYNHFESCTLTATANEGYTFVNWTENDAEVSTDATYIFTVTGPRTLVANFSLNNYDITVEANPAEGGTATGAGNYDHGTTATLGATANTGYHFVNWTKDGNEVSTDNPFDLIVTVAGNYVANFALNTYEVTATADPTEGGTITGTGVYDHGTTATLTATPAQGYAFSHWTNDYESEYFTIESLGDNNTITLTIPSGVTSEEMTSVSYSFDKTTWTTTTIDDDDQTISVTLNANEKVYWKGVGSTMAIGTDEDSHSSFLSDGAFKVYGNAMSLFHGDDFVGKTNDNDYYMAGLFYGSEVVDAFNLALPITTANSCYRNLFYGCSELESAPLLPATALSEYCYAYMFKNCTSLVKSPTLPAATLDRNSYYQMFYGCSALNEVTCLATDISASNCLTNWVKNVASTGTFRKASGMTDWTTGANGIPSGWTVEEASPAVPAEAVVTFTVTEPMHFVAHFTSLYISQEVTFAQGWNWWAPTVAATLQDLETALGVNGLAIMAEDGSTLNYVNGQWNGTLESLVLGQMYRINTSSPCEFTLTGAKPASVEVSLAHGAHWFGFTGSAPTAVGTVFGTTFGPVAGDKVVSQNGGFAIYNGTAWQGTLATLQPGQGYVYVSESNETKTLIMD